MVNKAYQEPELQPPHLPERSVSSLKPACWVGSSFTLSVCVPWSHCSLTGPSKEVPSFRLILQSWPTAEPGRHASPVAPDPAAAHIFLAGVPWEPPSWGVTY